MIINNVIANKYNSDKTPSPIVLSSILSLKKSFSNMRTMNIELFPLKTGNHGRKITSFQILPEN